MKKLISLALAMLLCFGAVAMAGPSVTTGDITESKVTEVTTETGVAVSEDFAIGTVDEQVAEEQAKACDQVVEDLKKASSVTEYFGKLEDNAGATVDLKAVLGTENPVVNEVVPLVVKNYDDSYGNVKTSFKFATPYQKDEPVVVVIRVVDPVTGKVTQVALKGKGTGVDGTIEVEFPPEVMKAIQNGNATMAVVSK